MPARRGEKISGASVGEPAVGTSMFNLYNASVNVSYMLDLFGGNKRELEALQSLVDYQDYQLKARTRAHLEHRHDGR